MVSVNEQAPDFELANDTGGTTRLSDFRGRKVILYFYPKALSKG
jgi:peroxiredoxin Q/BCP